MKIILWIVGGWSLWVAGTVYSLDNLIPNPAFDYPGDGLAGWVSDYAWSGNQWYVGNKERVAVVEAEQGKSKVARLTSLTGAGTKLECAPIPLEAGFCYRCSLDIKGDGFRVYIAGYRWKPTVQAHENPGLDELRMIYKGKARGGKAAGWKKVNVEFPGTHLTAQRLPYLEQVRFVTVYIWMERTGFIDNVILTKVRDSSLGKW